MRLHRPAAQRGRTEIGWLDSSHTFSFGEYYDEAWMGFRALRVINDDLIEGGQGFGTHPHRDMEIISWVMTGALEHRDSTGGGGVLRHGDVQVMTAGSGIRHSEFNPSPSERCRLIQIWIQPDRDHERPAYAQATVPAEQRSGRLAVVAAGGGRPASVAIKADAAVMVATLAAGQSVRYDLAPGRHAWIQVAAGTIDVGDQHLAEGDGLAISDESLVHMTAEGPAEVLVFDLK